MASVFLQSVSFYANWECVPWLMFPCHFLHLVTPSSSFTVISSSERLTCPSLISPFQSHEEVHCAPIAPSFLALTALESFYLWAPQPQVRALCYSSQYSLTQIQINQLNRGFLNFTKMEQLSSDPFQIPVLLDDAVARLNSHHKNSFWIIVLWPFILFIFCLFVSDL